MRSCMSSLAFNFFCLLLLSLGNEISMSKDELSFCGLAESSSRFIFVSTLDGKLTAINPNNEGSVIWTIHPGSESMLSSSIHKLELSNYGHFVRMIPSLNGGLYKFNGENIELIPVTSDHLLQSSLRYSDDLVISGGKETVTFGVSLETGNIIYECSMKGCGNISHSTDSGEILIVQKQMLVVRAVEPRTGTERWNFSVGNHDLKLVSECHSLPSAKLNYEINAIMPEGVIYATDAKNPNNVFWRQKFSSPVVSAWQLNRGNLIQLDFFSNKAYNFNPNLSPSLYIGMFNKQLYIQESITMLKKRNIISSTNNYNLPSNEANYPVIPWKPVSASNSLLGLTWQQFDDSKNDLGDISQRQTTALSVLYASSYVDGNGFFLYEEDVQKREIESSVASTESSLSKNNLVLELESNADETFKYTEVNTPVEIVVVSFWYYWKEVLVISATTAIICNLMITRTYWRWKYKTLPASSQDSGCDLETMVQEKDSGIETNLESPEEIANLNIGQEYVSRYLSDFDPVVCLGKGGFGVVFEAKNKIDDCHYAIKRILLPRKQESRERVLREVKALAKLDHHHIVRYFNAWTECPPTGWQEKQDEQWIDINSESYTRSKRTISTATTTNQALHYEESNSLCPADTSNFLKSSNNVTSEVNFYRNEISDSFVVFEKNSDDSQSYRVNSTVYENSSFINYETEKGKKTKATKSSSQPVNLEWDQSTSVESSKLSKIYLYIQMQLCQRHSLRDWLTVNKKRDYEYVLNIFEQILQAVEHVHLHGLIHRDLKPSNIFFSLDNQIKVGDFGLVTAMTEEEINLMPQKNDSSVSINEKHTAQVGTQLYMSKEQLLGKPYNYKVDIYSLGLILFELLVPFNTQMERIVVLQDVKKDKFPNVFQKTYKKEYDLLRVMLSDSPEERPTTYGIRARLPLKQEPMEEKWHFELPLRPQTSKNNCAPTNAELRVLK